MKPVKFIPLTYEKELELELKLKNRKRRKQWVSKVHKNLNAR